MASNVPIKKERRHLSKTQGDGGAGRAIPDRDIGSLPAWLPARAAGLVSDPRGGWSEPSGSGGSGREKWPPPAPVCVPGLGSHRDIGAERGFQPPGRPK